LSRFDASLVRNPGYSTPQCKSSLGSTKARKRSYKCGEDTELFLYGSGSVVGVKNLGVDSVLAEIQGSRRYTVISTKSPKRAVLARLDSWPKPCVPRNAVKP
jgi:hypothetical protein